MPNYTANEPCQVCGDPNGANGYEPMPDVQHLSCPNCGVHAFSGSAWAVLTNGQPLDVELQALRAYRIRKVATEKIISTNDLAAFATPGELPSAGECLDNLILHLAKHHRPGERAGFRPRQLRAALGVVSAEATEWALKEASTAGWVNLQPHSQLIEADNLVSASLSAQGWARHRQLFREATDSRHAFMAMDFKHNDIQRLFEAHLVPGVRRAGFELRTTEHTKKTAGLIDARMRVELLTSRFVVCDLTHNNRGAYWEAGFAEGAGRPVFYLCRADVLDCQDPESRPHFDIAHQAIVKWTEADPATAVDELVAMIRATLPGEATLEDPPPE